MNLKLPIYLDFQATTPVDPQVVEAMLPYFTEKFGNPSSQSHEWGWVASAAVERARTQVAALIGATEREIVFTGSATESINLAIQGVARSYRGQGKHILTSSGEHSAARSPCEVLRTEGFEITVLPVDRYGQINPLVVGAAIRSDTILVNVMAANNEIGTLNRISEIGKITRERNVIFHTDATQAVGKIPVDVGGWNVDLLSLSGHKIYGPKGVGALYVKRRNPRVMLTPQIYGGGHERGLRSGTLNVPAIVGLGKACQLANERMESDSRRIRGLRDELESYWVERIPGSVVHGHPVERLPNHLSIRFDGVDAQSLMLSLREIAVSSGSACLSSSLEPSHVLQSIGVSESLARGTLRITLGRTTLEEEIAYVKVKLVERVAEHRRLMRLSELEPG